MMLKFWAQFGMVNMFRQAKDSIRKDIYRKALIQTDPFISVSGTTEESHQILNLMDKLKKRELVVIQTSLNF